MSSDAPMLIVDRDDQPQVSPLIRFFSLSDHKCLKSMMTCRASHGARRLRRFAHSSSPAASILAPGLTSALS
jgi:hypothetical protein